MNLKLVPASRSVAWDLVVGPKLVKHFYLCLDLREALSPKDACSIELGMPLIAKIATTINLSSRIDRYSTLPWNHILPMLFTGTGYASVLSQHTRYAASAYNKHHRESSTKLFLNTVLSLHMASGLTEIIQWYFLTLFTGRRPTATLIDFSLCIM